MAQSWEVAISMPGFVFAFCFSTFIHFIISSIDVDAMFILFF